MPMIQKLLHLFWPSRCIGCGTVLSEEKEILCADCRKELKPLTLDQCVCRYTTKRYWLNGSCYSYCSGAAAPFRYDGTGGQIVLRLKRSVEKDAVNFLAQNMEKTVNNCFSDRSFDLICFVPMKWVKRRAHGFNHSEELARALAKRLKLPYVRRALTETGKRKPQHFMKRKDRARNVLGKYRADKKVVNGKTVLLVDDIITTGSTVEECAKVLKKAGAREVVACAAVMALKK